jgi:K+-sensing histidine kinase KdpD
MNVSSELMTLAPTDLTVYRTERYDGGGFDVSLTQFAPEDIARVMQLYSAVKKIYDLWLYMKDAPNYELLRQQIVTLFGSEQFLTSMQAIGVATYALKTPSPVIRKVVHDIRGGGLTVLTGTVYLLKESPDPHPEDIENTVLVARDHAKLMRNAIFDLDPTVRQADESTKVHPIDDFVHKWTGATFKIADKPVEIEVNCTFSGSITNRCLETSAIDRILYNYINNAARFTADRRVTLHIFPTGGSLVRWVVGNSLTLDQQRWLDETTGSDLKQLFMGGLTRGGHGLGLSSCADFVAASFGLTPSQALDEGYLGVRVIDAHFLAWFHWPAYQPAPTDPICDCGD